MVGYLTRPFLPRGFRCLGECCLCASNLGTAETETFSCFYFDCAHCCRCFCIYFVLCLRPGYPNPNGFYLAGLSISLLVTLSKPWQAHQKNSIKEQVSL